MTPTLSSADAWQPLSASDWNAEAAQHLLRRAAWTARPAEVDQAVRDGLTATLDRLFPNEPQLLPKPRQIVRLEEGALTFQQRLKDASADEKRMIQRESRERAQLALQDLSMKWLRAAVKPEQSAFAKWVLFLSDVYVVASEKANSPSHIFLHADIIARHALGAAPELTKAISRSPAMVIYLDLNQSQRTAPNENFARELFELFLLGEGNYSESDIKEAARAFTGYRAQQYSTEFRFVPAQHDATPKTIFGQTAPFTGDGVIDLAYKQPAAAAFLPHEIAKFYLSDSPLPPEYLASLGAIWREAGFNLRFLAQRFFGSRLFFSPEFRGGFIKSPVQYYLGLVQDLQIEVAPLPRYVLNPLRQMGQMLFNPPNIRGWVGGRNWINSSTLAARRALAESLFNTIDEKNLNADEQLDLLAARTDGAKDFTTPLNRFDEFAAVEPSEAAKRLVENFISASADDLLQQNLAQFIATGPATPTERRRRVRRATVALLQSPDYQLC
jgi:uncharacterized protein (DUF1800 family)